ncbi:MAG: T9SS C-terminal target domain-containing protein [Chlorobiota bacterium]|nr:MAG: T9SS C-terminal target domain-containing protein [Chlorobiota bacterium]
MFGKFFFSFVIVISTLLNAQWYRQEVPPGVNNISSVYFIDGRTGWATTFQGAILKTTNGGRNWAKLRDTSNISFNSIFFVDQNYGWVSGSNRYGYGFINRTSDGGLTWTSSLTTMFPFKKLKFTDRNTGWVTGGPVSRMTMGAINKTTDGGVTWQENPTDHDALYSDIDMVNDRHGWMTGRYGTIHKTTNGGGIWKHVKTISECSLTSVDFIDSLRGWVAGSNGRIFTTVDGGDNWTTISIGDNFWIESIVFTDRNMGWIAGVDTLAHYGFISKTTDGGGSWYQQTLSDNRVNTFYELFALDGQHLWASGDNGGLFFTSNGGDVYQAQSSERGYILLQNTPNPFSTTTLIKYALPPELRDQRVRVQLAIFDLTGTRVAQLVDEEKAYGTYDIRWNASGLPSGVYICRMVAGGVVVSKKMVVVR